VKHRALRPDRGLDPPPSGTVIFLKAAKPLGGVSSKIKRLLYGSVSKPIVPLVNIKIAGKWMFIPLKMVCIGIVP